MSEWCVWGGGGGREIINVLGRLLHFFFYLKSFHSSDIGLIIRLSI